MQAQLTPSYDLKQLVQLSGPTWHNYNRIAVHEHNLFALVHGFGHDIGRQVGLADLPIH